LAMVFLDKKVDIKLKTNQVITCNYTSRNKECILQACPYFGKKDSPVTGKK
jgi:hypothetical protein